MQRRDLVLAALAAGGNGEFTPVQVQKLFFLIDETIAGLVDGKKFNFCPNDYGPFDPAVYRAIESLQSEQLAWIHVNQSTRFRTYTLTDRGKQCGQTILNSMDNRTADYLTRLSQWVRSLSFSELVSTVYAKYPHMKERSIFVS